MIRAMYAAVAVLVLAALAAVLIGVPGALVGSVATLGFLAGTALGVNAIHGRWTR